MKDRAKYVKNSYNGDGTLLLGTLYQSPIKGKTLFGAGAPQGIYEVSTTLCIPKHPTIWCNQACP